MEYKLEKDVLTISLEGELNSVNSESVGEEIDKIIEGKAFKSLVLDFDNVSYISSAGLRIILKLKQRYDDFSVINASLEVYDVFQMTGFTSMMSIKKALRKIDLTGAEIIGDGFFSTVYRLNKDTIVKVFNRTSDPEQIERELRLAKEAFVLGVPTAISFDVVKVGDKMGVCFEMLDCMSLKTALLTQKGKYNEYVEKRRQAIAYLEQLYGYQDIRKIEEDLRKRFGDLCGIVIEKDVAIVDIVSEITDIFLKPDSKVVRELRRYSANVQKLSSIVITIRNPKKMSGSSIIKAEHKINLTYFQWSHSILRANGQTQNYPTTYFHL